MADACRRVISFVVVHRGGVTGLQQSAADADRCEATQGNDHNFGCIVWEREHKQVLQFDVVELEKVRLPQQIWVGPRLYKLNVSSKITSAEARVQIHPTVWF